MTAAGPQVRRYILRPLPWLAVSLMFVGLVSGLDIFDSRSQAARLRHALHVQGRVSDDYQGGADVPVSYFNPRTEQEVDTEAYVWHVRLPNAGDRVALEVDPDDPDEVVLRGDRFPATANLGWNLIIPLIPVMAIGLRWRSWRRTCRVGRGVRSFALLGTLVPAPRFGRYCQLHLFPVDAPPGSAPLCAVPVLTTLGLAVPGPAFPVVVKGVPRAAGRVVAQAGGQTMWPAGRALLTRVKLGRPEEVAAEATPVEHQQVERQPVEHATSWVRHAAPELGALAIALVLLVAVAAVVTRNLGDERRASASSAAVIVEIIENDPADFHVTVRYRGPDGEPVLADAPVDFPEDYTKGRRYPAEVTEGGIRLAREPYDAVEPIVWAVTPVVLAGALTVRRLVLRRRNARTLGIGHWRALTAWPAPGSRRGVLLGMSDQGVRMMIRTPLGLSTHPGQTVLVSREGVPGSPAAVIVDGRAVLPRSVALSPPWPPLVKRARVAASPDAKGDYG